MKKTQYYKFGKKLNKKRYIILLMITIWAFFQVSLFSERDYFFELTKQFIPVLTYEKEYGSSEIDYATDYQVPEWFYEDENEKSVIVDDLAEDDLVEEKKESCKEENHKDKITTLADGVNGIKFARKDLENPDFLLNKIFTVDANTNMIQEELDIKNLMDTDLTVEGIKDKKNYKILIYHTHGSESFIDSREGVKEDTIIGVGTYLAKLLEEEYGISVYHDETVYDVIDGRLDRSKAYENSYYGVKKILEENPSIEVIIDLHRDGVDEETHLITDINGKRTAKIMFLNGVSRSKENGEIIYLENPNKLNNLAFSFQMYMTGKENYGDFIRKIYVRSYRYNLHLLPRATLIEVGAQNNTIQEEKNAMEPLAAILDKVLSKKD